MRLYQFTKLVRALGMKGSFFKVRPNESTDLEFKLSKVLNQSTSKASTDIVNQYGVTGREFVMMNSDLFDPITQTYFVPKKYDYFVIDGLTFIIDDPMPLFEEGTGKVMGYRAYSKGK